MTTPISPAATRDDLVAMIHNRDLLISDLNQVVSEEHITRRLKLIADKAREWASHYPQSSDGRNPFVLFAEWVEGLAPQRSHKATAAPGDES